MTPIIEDSTARILSASDITIIDPDRAVVSQFLGGKLLLLDMQTGRLTRTIAGPAHIADTALVFAHLQTYDGPFRPTSLDIATSYRGSGMSSPTLPKSHHPRYTRVTLRDPGHLDAITRVEIPGVSIDDGYFAWMTVMGITTLSTTDFSVLKFVPLEVRGGRFPQFLFFSPIPSGGWWHGTFDIDLWLKDSTATLPLFVRFDSSGHQSTMTIPLPNEAKHPGFFFLTNDIVKTSRANFGVLNARDGSLIMGNFDDGTTHHVPLVSADIRKELGLDSSTSYVHPCLLDDNSLEIVATTPRSGSDSTSTTVLSYTIDWSARRARLTAIRTPANGYVIGPGATTVVHSETGIRREMIRLIRGRSGWTLARRNLP